ncbi:MAG: low-specificity L-threonine aldolase [Chloroflexota bacterium]
MQFIDLRSDTVTKPTPEMREAMAKAEVGDDVYQDDPTVNELQALAAAKLGKEAGLFVPSGTMGNLAAILAHCGRGDEVIMGQKAHTFLHEGGGISTLGGVHSCQIKEQPDGSLDLNEVEAAIRFDDIHEPVTRLIEIENTHNACGGVFQTPEYIQKLSDFAHGRDLIVHMDGARLFNSAVAQGVDVSQITKNVDSVTFCLSKGLCAPVGSVLCGDQNFIKKANRIRKHLGGGMRQAGILAAAGIIALNTMVDRLAEDHIRAKNLASGLREINNIQLEPEIPSTNMVFFNLSDHVKSSTSQIEKQLEDKGILAHASGPRRFRLVTHYWITDQDVNQTVETLKQILQ